MTMSLDEKQSQITGTHELKESTPNKPLTLNRTEAKHEQSNTNNNNNKPNIQHSSVLYIAVAHTLYV